MGFLSSLTDSLGDAFHSATNTLGDSFSGIEHWLTGSSNANRQYRYQSALNSTQMAFESQEAQKAFERESRFNAEQAALAAQRQYDYTKQYFDYQAAYNTPAAQMERLREAGLNPNLVYGNGAMAMQSGAASLGGQEASAHSSSPRGSAGSATGGVGGDIGAVLNGIVGAARGVAELRRVNAEADLTRQRTRELSLKNERVNAMQRPVMDAVQRAKDAVGTMRDSGFFPHVWDRLRDTWDKAKSIYTKQAEFSGRVGERVYDFMTDRYNQIRDWYNADAARRSISEHFRRKPELEKK